MATFKEGQTVEVRCRIHEGAFPTEYLVTIEATPEPVSGFVKRDDVKKEGEGTGYLLGKITEVSEDKISVLIRGSFFTTTGLASFSRESAESHLEPIQNR
ncbi:MAG: hypothetical protein HYU38_05400 [Candidatus Tectomicrobia bacterium]|nr:hypothetical protein [Candidatus Tectomicrobia bacterium]